MTPLTEAKVHVQEHVRMHLSLSMQLYFASTSTSLSSHPFAVVIGGKLLLSVCLLSRLYASCAVHIEGCGGLLPLQLTVALGRLAKIWQPEEQ